jgi:hypothetical protein
MFDRLIDSSSDKALVAKFVTKNFELLEELDKFVVEEKAIPMVKFILPGRSIKFYDKDDFPLLTRLKQRTDLIYKFKDLRSMENPSGVYFIITLN